MTGDAWVIIVRYLTREVILTLLIVTTVLLIAFVSQQSVRYLNWVAIGRIPAGIVFQLVSFEIPYLLAILLPLCLYLSVLLVYGRMHAENEMAILHMSGFGNKRVMRLTFVIALFAGLFVLYLMVVINPWISEKRQEVMASDEATIHLTQTLMPGRFRASPDGNHVMYVEKLSRDHQRAQNVFLANEMKNPDDRHNNWALVLANQGYQTQKKKTSLDYFVLNDGFRYEGMPGQKNYKIFQFKNYFLRVPQNNDVRIHPEDEATSTLDLWRDYANPKRAAAFQWRISIAIATFILTLLAVPLSSVRPRQGRYLAIIPAVLIYIVYLNLLLVTKRWVEQGTLPISFGMWWVHGLALIFLVAVMAIRFRKRI